MSAHTCQHMVRGDNGQVACGCPATHYWMTAARRFHLCTTHARAVVYNTRGKTPVYEIPEALRAKPEARNPKPETTEVAS